MKSHLEGLHPNRWVGLRESKGTFGLEATRSRLLQGPSTLNVGTNGPLRRA